MTSMIPGVSCVIWLARIPYDLCHVLGIMQVDGGFWGSGDQLRPSSTRHFAKRWVAIFPTFRK